MEIADIQRLVDIIQNARISELVVTTGTPQRTIRLRKPISAPSPKPVKKAVVPVLSSSEVRVQPSPVMPEFSPDEVFVTSSVVGIFHGIDSMSQIGTDVRAGEVLGSIESMKVMNDVVSRHDGVIAESFVEDGMPVEYGHRLFRLKQS